MNTKQLAYICATAMGITVQSLEPATITFPEKPETKYGREKEDDEQK